jgi:hypothetical protein
MIPIMINVYQISVNSRQGFIKRGLIKMKWNIKTDDIRWWKGGALSRCTYLESLKSQIERGNCWIYTHEWNELRKRLPGMTEEQAKIELFRITNEITDRVERDHRMFD